ncbi:enoyl-CoA hydratase/isomerase family protein [Janibacter alkaliphilus]|uniref:3-hydroxyisobutyryl-CoA hydrolase n=1 Tax=Janibacter alkaliphilus TaxID=1069963 RepID=A0A852X783_9MICO|nr:enoyl-CoA hydratase/isomerase family protein [Janibacter alkaliphilus]NYG36124.1 enoyl-CoA hydratase [Janibacter alkaliphilus]
MTTFEPGPGGSDEVLFAQEGALGRVLLNRPRALNSLSRAMIAGMQAQLEAWAQDDAVAVVSLEGAGDRGFCAGGDVRAVRQAHLEGLDGARFFGEEYALDALLAEYPRPVIAVMDGITMGGGVGLGMNADLRVVTERTALAMPETTIGFFPDVGATYRLAQSPGELGTHVALTGVTVDGADAIALGLADVLVPAEDVPALLEQASASGTLPEAGERSPASPLAGQRAWIDAGYAGDDPGAILQRLEDSDVPEARAAAETIRAKSPLSVAITLAALRQAGGAGSLREVLDTDARIAAAMLADSDFGEGVRAQLVDKDRSPSWRHARVEDVTPDEVARYLG